MHSSIDVHSRTFIDEFSGDGLKCIEKLQSHPANMTFVDKSRYDRVFQKVTHKGRDSAISYIKGFQNTQALSVSLVNTYSEYQIMHIYLYKFL